jgi:hypothetical protein
MVVVSTILLPLHRLARSFTSTMPRRWGTIPGLLEIDWGLPPDLATNDLLELFKGVSALGETTNCITIVCGQGVAMVIDAEDPMGRVISVAYHLRPRFGKSGMLHTEKPVQMTELNQPCARFRVISGLANLMRRIRKRLHRPNENKLSDR